MLKVKFKICKLFAIDKPVIQRYNSKMKTRHICFKMQILHFQIHQLICISKFLNYIHLQPAQKPLDHDFWNVPN